MKIKPTMLYQTPKYPTLKEAELDPAILENKTFSLNGKKIAFTASIIAMLCLNSGCVHRTSGDVPAPDFLNEDDILGIVKQEAIKNNINFADSPFAIQQSQREIEINLFNQEKQFGFALYNDNKPTSIATETLQFGTIRKIHQADKQIITTYDINDVYEEASVREAFREFLDWLKAEGML